MKLNPIIHVSPINIVHFNNEKHLPRKAMGAVTRDTIKYNERRRAVPVDYDFFDAILFLRPLEVLIIRSDTKDHNEHY